jgi:hypothetical protein
VAPEKGCSGNRDPQILQTAKIAQHHAQNQNAMRAEAGPL